MAAGPEGAMGAIRAYMQHLGVIELVFVVMQNHSTCPDTMSHGCRMVANMAIGQVDEVNDALIQAGAYAVMTTALAQFPKHASLEKNAYRALVNLGFTEYWASSTYVQTNFICWLIS